MGVVRTGWAACAVVLALLTGCGAAPAPRPAPPTSTAEPTAAAVPVPADGVLLGAFGYQFGPRTSFSLPRSTRLAAAVDQADNVTAVLSTPAPAQVAAYLRRALPAAGYELTADDPAVRTLTFRGHGWTGSFTGRGTTSAVLLRPG